MSGFVGQWVLKMAGAAMISAVLVTIVPEGMVKNVVRTVCGFLMMYVLLSAASDFDMTAYTAYASAQKAEGEAVVSEAIEAGEQISGVIIREQLEAYISDKGAELGLKNMTVSVQVRWDRGGYWYPCGVHICADAHEIVKSEMMQFIEREIGIKGEDQVWSTYNGD